MTTSASPFPAFSSLTPFRILTSFLTRRSFAWSDAIVVIGASFALSVSVWTWTGVQKADPIRWLFEAICMSNTSGYEGRPLGTVVPISSEALPSVPGKRITIVKVTYPPGGYTPPHRHAGSVTGYVTAGAVRSQLAGGPPGTYVPGQSFFEPPGAFHIVSENASMTEPAELIAVFIADEGATLTVFD